MTPKEQTPIARSSYREVSNDAGWGSIHMKITIGKQTRTVPVPALELRNVMNSPDAESCFLNDQFAQHKPIAAFRYGGRGMGAVAVNDDVVHIASVTHEFWNNGYMAGFGGRGFEKQDRTDDAQHKAPMTFDPGMHEGKSTTFTVTGTLKKTGEKFRAEVFFRPSKSSG